jgi:hypothetical protein
MKKSILFFLVILSQFCLLRGQDSYKQNVLNLLKNLPEVKTWDASYNFFKCADNSCNGYKAVKTNLAKAFDDITSAELTTSNAMTSMAQPTSMTKEQADALSAKLDKMTDAEKQQWAMQNAQTMMNPSAFHANQDADNTAVNDAVDYVTKQQKEDMKDGFKPSDISTQFKTIEDKYQPREDALLKAYETTCGGGEASDAEIARCKQAYIDYKNNVIPLYNAELNDKLSYFKSQIQKLIAKYSTTEEKEAITHYGDDAQESMNKNHLYMAQQTVLSNVMDIFGNYEDVLLYFANKYADLQKIEHVKGFPFPEHK